ncbi:MAG TPA: preprotein translocase subunit SecE [Candidatus Saccharicenans sp.]|nr:preprotein translocase subunit SecE [Candidatus Saccharicenans sp.]HOL46253.1 preprotein translocase subunit SecE [Candidatus Saccharicenans sp.]HOM94623.1 preprotein translocase subunit SecE [Candidatus Saccharicenans sp.]HPP24549.1 preprotein translocase subunit SecE [Candidatus Saccharicenans sp.]HQI22842.1 preprotein translocase subunit SecE [Candidatus Saccharicenans sp.]
MSEKLAWYKRLWNYLKDVRAELKKVTWPSRKEVYGTTVVVIVAVLFFGFYLFFIDVLASWLITQIKALFG